jgi:hypothetical protein
MHRNARSSCDVCAGLRRLLAGYAAADGVEFETSLLRSLKSNTQSFAQERRDGDASLFHVENNCSARRLLCGRIFGLC